MLRPLLMVSLSLLSVRLLLAQGTKSTSSYQPVPVAEARRPNPVKPTPESVASGKKIFGFDCAQ